jgi:hypothetical protein
LGNRDGVELVLIVELTLGVALVLRVAIRQGGRRERTSGTRRGGRDALGLEAHTKYRLDVTLVLALVLGVAIYRDRQT